MKSRIWPGAKNASVGAKASPFLKGVAPSAPPEKPREPPLSSTVESPIIDVVEAEPFCLTQKPFSKAPSLPIFSVYRRQGRRYDSFYSTCNKNI